MKVTEEKNHNILHERIDRIQKKVDANQRFVIGAGAVLATLGLVAQIAFPIYRTLTTPVRTSMMDAPASIELSEFVDEYYVTLLSGRLEKFSRKKNGLYNFRCPLLW